MAERRLIDANALLREMRNSGRAAYMLVMDAPTIDPESLPEEEPCQKWHPASEIPLLHHEVDENKCEGTFECDVSEQLLLYTEEEGYKVGVYMKDCYGFDGWLNPDYGGTIHHVVEWQYPQKPSRERDA